MGFIEYISIEQLSEFLDFVIKIFVIMVQFQLVHVIDYLMFQHLTNTLK